MIINDFWIKNMIFRKTKRAKKEKQKSYKHWLTSLRMADTQENREAWDNEGPVGLLLLSEPDTEPDTDTMDTKKSDDYFMLQRIENIKSQIKSMQHLMAIYEEPEPDTEPQNIVMLLQYYENQLEETERLFNEWRKTND